MKQLFLPLLLAFSFVAGAQNKIQYNIAAGAGIYNLSGEAVNSLSDIIDATNGIINNASRTGFFAGGGVTVPVNEHIAIAPGIYYTQKGYSLKGDFSVNGSGFLGANARTTLTSHYIDVPVLAKYQAGGFQIFAGPQASFLVNAGLRTKAGALGITLFDRNIDATEQFSKFDFGVTGGIGYQLPGGLTIFGLYDHGLTKVDANRNADTYNRGFKVGLGFQF